MLTSVMQGKASSPVIGHPATRNISINPELRTFGSFDLDAIVRVGGVPGTEALPVPVVAHDVAGRGVVEEVDGVFVGALAGAEAVGGCEVLGTAIMRRGLGRRTVYVDVGLAFMSVLTLREREVGRSLLGLGFDERSSSCSDGEEAIDYEVLEGNHCEYA